MSEKELLCAALYNTPSQKSENLGNSNPTYGVQEQFCEANPIENIDEANIHLKSAIRSDQVHTEHEGFQENVRTGSYGAISLDSDLKKCSNPSSGNSELCNSLENVSPKRVADSNLGDSEQEDCDEDVMTGSYGEISLDRELVYCDKNSDSLSSREDELSSKLDDLTCLNQEHVQQVHQSQQTSEGRTTSAEVSSSLSSEEFAMFSSDRVRTGSDTSGLSELQDSSFPGSRSSTPSLYRQEQPNLHIIDPNILTDLESHAKKVATCVDTMLENLSGTLQSISSLTVDCMETYESSVCKTCDAVDVNIKAVYQLMAKCEELSNSMGRYI
ncbi:BLOC-1-related complex subunit 6 [Caerostris extrusa]|uniref:BLOC-1-related complex subunit 6 n=1 Tax=Caerostris extrusa TaxID=172846 RepID=A0AAV4Y0K1_CAEEX|nr:BLOC-1-related complex subunit 6 [Caerostris extrusa]